MNTPAWLSVPLRLNRVSAEDRYLLVRQLHVLQKAGVPLLSSLHALEAQGPPGPLKQTLHGVCDDLLGGYTLSQAFARHPDSFNPLFVALIRVGEAGGLLDEMLKRLAELFEWELELSSKIKQALQYPTIVLGTLLVALGIMVGFVLPRFAQFFGSLGIDLPFQTRMILVLSQFVGHYGVAMVILLIICGIAFWRTIHTERGRLWWHRTLLRLPLVGPLFVQLAMSRFSRTTAALNASGVTILETLALAGESVNNRYIQMGLSKVRDRVKGGEPLAKALAVDGLFPPIVLQMVATGEETGQIDELLHSVSDYYDQQTTYLLRKLITYIEPLLLIVVGLGVLLMATAVLLPMWDLVKLFKQQGG